MKFDGVHRVGTFSNNKVRPIVAKFHNFKDRETVRQKTFENNHALKRANLGIGQQWPSEVRETRKICLLIAPVPVHCFSITFITGFAF